MMFALCYRKILYLRKALNSSIDKKILNVLGIYVEIIGRAYCQWVSGAGRESRTNVGEELYLNENTFLVGGVNGACCHCVKYRSFRVHILRW